MQSLDTLSRLKSVFFYSVHQSWRRWKQMTVTRIFARRWFGNQQRLDLCDDTNENPEERFPFVQDPSLVRAGQMASLCLLHALPSTNKAEYAIKMYGSKERRFNHLLRERTCAQKAHKPANWLWSLVIEIIVYWTFLSLNIFKNTR